MSRATAEQKHIPRFTTDRKGRPTGVRLDTPAYVTLLVRAGVTDSALRPPGMEKGARALARIREIEADAIRRHGEFDWEKLSGEVQDEYDGLCILLDGLQDTGERIPLADISHAKEPEPTQ